MKECTTPDLCDEHGDSIQVSLANYLSYGAIGKFYGQVDTVKCPDDNSIVNSSEFNLLNNVNIVSNIDYNLYTILDVVHYH